MLRTGAKGRNRRKLKRLRQQKTPNLPTNFSFSILVDAPIIKNGCPHVGKITENSRPKPQKDPQPEDCGSIIEIRLP